MQFGSYFRRVSDNYSRFSQWTAAEDLITVELARLRDFSLRSQAVLDVGAGNVHFLQRVAAENVYPDTRFIALDQSPDMLLRHAGSLSGNAGAVSEIGRVLGDICHLPIANQSIDRVIGRQVLHYVDPAIAVREIARVLRTGGIFHSTQQVDYDDVPDAWYTEWSALRDAPARRRLSNIHLDDAVARAGLAEVSRTDVPVHLEYTWHDLAYKYGRLSSSLTEIFEFFQGSPEFIKSQFAMHIDAQGIRYSSRFRVSAFQVQPRAILGRGRDLP